MGLLDKDSSLPSAPCSHLLDPKLTYGTAMSPAVLPASCFLAANPLVYVLGVSLALPAGHKYRAGSYFSFPFAGGSRTLVFQCISWVRRGAQGGAANLDASPMQLLGVWEAGESGAWLGAHRMPAQPRARHPSPPGLCG